MKKRSSASQGYDSDTYTELTKDIVVSACSSTNLTKHIVVLPFSDNEQSNATPGGGRGGPEGSTRADCRPEGSKRADGRPGGQSALPLPPGGQPALPPPPGGQCKPHLCTKTRKHRTHIWDDKARFGSKARHLRTKI